MKTGTVAKSLGIDVKTVKTWTDEFGEFFSPGARGESRTQRFYTEEDVLTLNTIRVQRSSRVPAEKITELLKSEFRDRNFPPEYFAVEGQSAMVQYAQIAQLQARLGDAQAEISFLRNQLTDKDSRIESLNREIGKLQAKIEILNEEDD